MTSSIEQAARRQVRFRDVNDRIADLFADAVGEDRETFICECSRDDCSGRLELSLGEYAEVRRGGQRFIVVPGHQLDEIERVVEHRGTYLVVEKYGEARDIAVESDPRRR